MTRQAYLDLLGREADPATGRRMVFGRLPIKPREADLLGAVAELAPDHVTYVGPRRMVAAALGCSPKSVDRYVSAVCAAGYLVKTRQGNGLRLAIDVAAVVNGPTNAHPAPQGVDSNGQQTRDPSAPKPQGLDKSGQVRLPASIPTRRELAAKLVVTLGQAVALVTAIVCYGRHCRRLKTPVNAVRNGDAWQLLMFDGDQPTTQVRSAPKVSKPRKVSTPTVARSGQVSTPIPTPSISITIPSQPVKSESIKTNGPDGSLRISWGRELSRSDLRDVRTLLDELFPKAVACGAAHADDVQRHRFVAFACEIDRTWSSMKNPIGNFTQRMTSPDRYGKTWQQRGTAQADEDKARKMIASLRQPLLRPAVIMPRLRDPDEALAASRDDQARRLLERYGAAAQPAPRPTAEAVAV